MTFRSLAVSTLAAALALAAAPALAEAKDYKLTYDIPVSAKVNEQTSAYVHLLPGPGMHVNTEFPTAMQIALPKEFEGASGRVKPQKIDKTEATFQLNFTPKKSGERQVSGTVSFVVCNDAQTQCVPQRVPIAFNVKAQ